MPFTQLRSGSLILAVSRDVEAATLPRERFSPIAHLRQSDCQNKLQLLTSLRQSRSVIRPTVSLGNDTSQNLFVQPIPVTCFNLRSRLLI